MAELPLSTMFCKTSVVTIALPESIVMKNWQNVGDALCGQWNIVGVDLMSGVSAATWGNQEPTDWDLAAARLGNEVLKHCPRWLVFVHGIGASPAAEDAFDGANLASAAAVPVVLSNPQKLVYVALQEILEIHR